MPKSTPKTSLLSPHPLQRIQSFSSPSALSTTTNGCSGRGLWGRPARRWTLSSSSFLLQFSTSSFLLQFQRPEAGLRQRLRRAHQVFTYSTPNGGVGTMFLSPDWLWQEEGKPSPVHWPWGPEDQRPCQHHRYAQQACYLRVDRTPATSARLVWIIFQATWSGPAGKVCYSMRALPARPTTAPSLSCWTSMLGHHTLLHHASSFLLHRTSSFLRQLAITNAVRHLAITDAVRHLAITDAVLHLLTGLCSCSH